MKKAFYLSALLLLVGCKSVETALIETGDLLFRRTYNYPFWTPTDEQLDSISKTKPNYRGNNEKDVFYRELIRKGIVSDRFLDTSGLNMQLLNFEKTRARFGNMDISLVTDIKAERQFFHVKIKKDSFSVALGKTLLADRYVVCLDVDDDEKQDILLLSVFYIMGGDNFEMKKFSFIPVNTGHR
ncbi:MAG: hypothetical protein QM781_00195 [Chitinophagaceae bacterium]